MIKLLLWSCALLVGLMAALYGLFAAGKIGIMAFAMLSALVIVAITFGHIYFVVTRQRGPKE